MKHCTVEDCVRPHLCRGLCRLHYSRLYTKGLLVLRHRTTHGLTRTVEYRAWERLRNRCNNKNNVHYRSYGGRGITVCESWNDTHGFIQFFTDMGKRPTPKHSVDRINNDGNYEPSNCRWATWHTQATNRRDGSKDHPGVYRQHGDHGWIAQITINNKHVEARFFLDLEKAKAHRAYLVDKYDK